MTDSMTVTNAVSDEHFDKEVLEAELPVLVDFWADWCGPCKMLTPTLQEIAVTYEGRLKVVTLNIDDNTVIPQRFGVRGIPTLILFKKGELLATRVGLLTKSQLHAFLDSHL
jgi:thioredoxin 1